MRLIYFLLILILTFVTDVSAQLKPAQSQYLKEKGFLVNPSFEQGYKSWTIGGTCTKSLVSEVPYLNKSLKLTCVNQNFTVKQETTKQTALSGQQGVFGLQIKTNFDGTRVTHLAGGARTNDIRVNANASFQRLYTIPYIINSVSSGIEIYSDINITGEIIIDDVEFGLAPDGFVAQDLDDVPVGTVMAYGSETLPQGYLLADGTCYLKSEKAALFAVIGTDSGECTISTAGDGFRVPDLRGKFIRGHDAGAGVDPDRLVRTACSAGGNSGDGLASCQDDSNESHNHYTLSSTAATYADGVTVNASNQASVQKAAGSFSVNYTMGGVANSANVGNSSYAGGNESRPLNVYLAYIIKAEGRPSRNIVAQKSLSPDKAGFIYFSAMESDIVGFLKADGSCILESAYPDFIANTGVDTFGDCTINTAGDGSRLPDLLTNNRFVRMAGGSLAVGQTQTSSNKEHSHVQQVYAYSNNIFGGVSSVTSRGDIRQSNISTPASSEASALSTNPSGSTEARPHSIALTAYVRMVDADIVRGSFEQIKTQELIRIKYRKGDTQTLFTSANDVIKYNTLDYDNSNGAYNTTTGIFTAPKTSKFKACANISVDSAAQSYGTVYQLNIVHAGVAFQKVDRRLIYNAITDYIDLNGCATFEMQQGDTLYFDHFHNSGINRQTHANAAYNFMTIAEEPTTEGIIKNLNDNAVHRLGDCKFSVLSAEDFNKIHSGSWLRMEGQSLAGTDLDNRFGISSFPDAVSNGAFFRQNGGNSAALRAFQDDQNEQHNHNLGRDTFAVGSSAVGLSAAGGGIVGFGTGLAISYGTTNGEGEAVIQPSGGNEARPKNISLNFYCLVSE